jgi:hypothetical protein
MAQSVAAIAAETDNRETMDYSKMKIASCHQRKAKLQIASGRRQQRRSSTEARSLPFNGELQIRDYVPREDSLTPTSRDVLRLETDTAPAWPAVRRARLTSGGARMAFERRTVATA